MCSEKRAKRCPPRVAGHSTELWKLHDQLTEAIEDLDEQFMERSEEIESRISFLGEDFDHLHDRVTKLEKGESSPPSYSHEDYLAKIAERHSSIVMSDCVTHRAPTIRRRNLSISSFLFCLRDGMSIVDIQRTYNLSTKEIFEALSYIIDVLGAPFDDRTKTSY